MLTLEEAKKSKAGRKPIDVIVMFRILAADVRTEANDVRQLTGMLNQAADERRGGDGQSSGAPVSRLE